MNYDSTVPEERWREALDVAAPSGAKSSALMVADVEEDLPHTLSALSWRFRSLLEPLTNIVIAHVTSSRSTCDRRRRGWRATAMR